VSFSLDKLWQNIEVKLRGRGALMVAILAVLAVIFWLVIRDYSQHPMLSQIVCYAVLSFIFLIAIMTQFGKARPEEVPEKTVMQVDRIGMFFAKGLSSREELTGLVRQWNGIKKLPPPNSRVQGVATQEKNYEELSQSEAENFVAQVEESVRGMLAREAQRISAQLEMGLSPGPSVPQLGNTGVQKGGAPGVMRSGESNTPHVANSKDPATPKAPTD
jgi:hypothetical protein